MDSMVRGKGVEARRRLMWLGCELPVGGHRTFGGSQGLWCKNNRLMKVVLMVEKRVSKRRRK